MTGFNFNTEYARPFRIGFVTPNGIIYSVNGRKMSWKRKDAIAILNMLPPFEEFDSKIFQQIKNEMCLTSKLSQSVTGRIICNLYFFDLAEKLGVDPK